MKPNPMIAAALFAAAMSLGCGDSGAGPSGASGVIAVIDLDEVARQLGSDKQIAAAVKARQDALNERLTRLAGGYVEQLEQRRNAASGGETPGGVRLARYEQQANQNLGLAKQQAQDDLAKRRSELILAFRERVRPIAREVAHRRGFSVIVTKQESLLYDYDPRSDITLAVVEALRGQAAEATAGGE